MYSAVYNLRRRYDLHQKFFSLSLGDGSLEEYYAKFCGNDDELSICKPISNEIPFMKHERERLQVARVLFDLPTSYDAVRS